MHLRRRLLLSTCGPIVFGVGMAVAKGQDEGMRNALGNVSAPWLLLPFAVGAQWPGIGRAALSGTAASLLALTGFYGALSFIFDLAPNPWYVDVQRTFRAGSIYFPPGVVAGAVFGALGALWGRYRLLAAALTATLAVLCEPLALHTVGIDRGSGNPLRYPLLWVTEMTVGAVLTVYAAHCARKTALAELRASARRRLGL